MDQEGFVWVGNFAKNENPPTNGSISKFTPDGMPLSPEIGFIEGGANRVQGLAVDQEGNIWFANFGNDSIGMYPGGNPRQAQKITGGGLNRPFGVAIDGQGFVWVTNGAFENSTDSVSKFRSNGVPVTHSPFTGGGLNSPKGIAIDSQGNAWIANLGQLPHQPSDSVTMLRSNGWPSAGSPYTGGGILGAWGIAVDGKDNIWVANFVGESVSHLCGANPANCPPGHQKTGDPISPSTGYTSDALQRLTSVVIDSSGNVWVPNNWKNIPIQANPGGDGLVVFIGLAPPVKTPLNGLPQQP
jgi:hypothetical protein